MSLCGFTGKIDQNETDTANCSMNCSTLNLMNSTSSMSWISTKNVINSGMMFASGFFGNLLALIVLLKSSKEQRRTIFYRLVAGLTITDLIGTTLVSPVVIIVYVKKMWIGGDYLCTYFGFMMIMAGFSTMTIVCAMSVERILCIRHPYIYYTRLSKKHATFILVGCWVVSAIIASLPLLGFGEFVRKYPGTWCYFDYYSKEPVHIAFNYFISILAMSIIIVTMGCNLTVIYTILKSRQKQGILRKEDGTSRSIHGASKRYAECQMLILLVGITIVFSACYTPLYVRIIMNQTGLVCNTLLDLQLIRLASFNQILDPWVYILLRRELLWKIISGVKYIFNRNQSDKNTLKQKTFDVDSANCCVFCFHCLCDPPVVRQRSGSVFSQDSQYIRACPGRSTLNASSVSNLKSTSLTSLNGRQSVPLRVSSANDVHMLLLNNTLRKHATTKSTNTRFVDDIEND
ncbi:prostaglandin E2 receptor EP4 subtype-like [Saccostrea echinata]|uniref:prostaglandin E2 receptor EP4 subtype-like n=1 Tax=Saccostrea echinata TaxID=191078 RepID=UPI002A82E08A|nr:prostaglandin E2 receptor EP4 subtype-like [Saccostrea echinata]